MKKILISLSVFFIGFSFAANDTSSSISGSINVPGATITVEHVPTGSTKSSAANDAGNFNFSGLRPGGPYVITASAAGFNTERDDNVYFTLAESNSFDVVLVSSTAIEDVVVTGVRSGISSSGPGSTITADDIALTASIDKGIGDFLKRDSRFAIQGTFRDVQISALGSNNRYNNFTIDGVAANDPLGLNANGFASVRNPISVETLAQIRVDFAPYSVTKGNFGGATFEYQFSTNTSDSDPGAGKLKLNNSTVSSATVLYIDDTDGGSTNTDIQAYLRTIDDSTSTIKGHFRISNKLNADDFALFTIPGLTEATGYFRVSCNHVSGSASSFSNNEEVIITFARTGDKGSTGAQGATGSTGPTGAQPKTKD